MLTAISMSAVATNGVVPGNVADFIPFIPESYQFQLSPTDLPEITSHSMWRTWLFIASSNERGSYYQFSLMTKCDGRAGTEGFHLRFLADYSPCVPYEIWQEPKYWIFNHLAISVCYYLTSWLTCRTIEQRGSSLVAGHVPTHPFLEAI